MSQRDFYEILGVAKDADADSIKRAYRKLAMQYHPDKNPGNMEAEEKFKEAASAYEILSNPEKRAQYDRFGHQAFGNGMGGAGFSGVEDIFSHFGDIFGDLFGMGGTGTRSRRRNQARRGADLRYVVQVDLREVIEGAEKQIEFDTQVSCEDCSGSGAHKGSTASTCDLCGGTGQVVRSQGFFQMATTCPSCSGEGQVIKNPCKSCKGSGRQRQHRKIRMNIPPGVDTGTRLRVGGEGEGGYNGGPTGDLYVEISVKEDQRFSREDEHLITDVDVDYLQLILGAEIEVPTVTGTARLEIPAGTESGAQLKIADQGLPNLRGSRRGNLYVNLNVQFPKKLSKTEEKLLREIAQDRKINVKESGLGSIFSRKK